MLQEECGWEWGWKTQRGQKLDFWPGSTITCMGTPLGLFLHLLNESVSPNYVKHLLLSMKFSKIRYLNFARVSNSSFILPWNNYKFNFSVACQHIFMGIMKTEKHSTVVWKLDTARSPVEKSCTKEGRKQTGKSHCWTLEIIKAKLSRLHNQFSS